jgi:hypothetical protein
MTVTEFSFVLANPAAVFYAGGTIDGTRSIYSHHPLINLYRNCAFGRI